MSAWIMRIYEAKCRKYETLTLRLQLQLWRETMAEVGFAAYTMEKCMAGGDGR